MKFEVQDMTCGGCAKSVTKAIQSVDPNATVKPDPAARTVKVETAATIADIERVLEEAGYPAAAT